MNFAAIPLWSCGPQKLKKSPQEFIVKHLALSPRVCMHFFPIAFFNLTCAISVVTVLITLTRKPF